jgi:peroxiredoxin
VARAYGAIGGGIGGTLRGMLGMAERVTFVIDEKGRIARVIENVTTKGHAEQVLALL